MPVYGDDDFIHSGLLLAVFGRGDIFSLLGIFVDSRIEKGKGVISKAVNEMTPFPIKSEGNLKCLL